MNRRNKQLAQKIVALIVIAALLQMLGVSVTVITFLVGAGLFVSFIARRSEQRETHSIFTFFISADEILRNEERNWYGFEVAEVVNDAERVMNSMPDPPALCYFATGALCHRAGDYARAVEHLSPLIDSEWVESRRLASPSPQLRRYVDFLRALEREPSIAPQALGAVRSLERLRQKSTVQLVIESRERLTQATAGTKQFENYSDRYGSFSCALPAQSEASLNTMVAPPSIADVLHEVYEDEQQAS